ATPIAKSILFFIATVTAVTCSAALPTIGKTISPMNVALRPESVVTASIAPTMNSAQTATSAVDMSKINTAVERLIFASSSPGDSASSGLLVGARGNGCVYGE